MKRLVNLDNLLIGSDPEFFLERNGVIVPSTDIIMGDKDSPINYGKVKIFKDNVLVEGNIIPASTKVEFINTMINLKNTISEVSGCTIISKDSHKFSNEDLDSENAQVFGCSPYNHAWQNTELTSANLSGVNYRSAGFHIHVGYQRDNNIITKDMMDRVIAKAYDFFAINPSRLHSNDAFRNENYGEYGSSRHKPYGVEVRSLGGFFSQDEYLGWVYEQTIKTLEFVSKIENVRKLQVLTSPKFTNTEYKFLNINLKKQLL